MTNFKINKMYKATLTVFFILILFTTLANAQKIDLGDYEMEIIEVFNKNSVGTAFSGKNKKYVGIEIMLIPKSKKNDGFLLNTMLLKSGNENYNLIYKRGSTVHLQGQFIKLRKPTKILIFALVDKKFLKGDLTFKDNIIVSIMVKNGNKIGTFKTSE